MFQFWTNFLIFDNRLKVWKIDVRPRVLTTRLLMPITQEDLLKIVHIIYVLFFLDTPISQWKIRYFWYLSSYFNYGFLVKMSVFPGVVAPYVKTVNNSCFSFGYDYAFHYCTFAKIKFYSVIEYAFGLGGRGTPDDPCLFHRKTIGKWGIKGFWVLLHQKFGIGAQKIHFLYLSCFIAKWHSLHRDNTFHVHWIWVFPCNHYVPGLDISKMCFPLKWSILINKFIFKLFKRQW